MSDEVGPYDWSSPYARMYPMLANGLSWDQIQTKASVYTMQAKLDGVRCMVHKTGDHVSMWTRTLHNLDDKFPRLVEQFQEMEGDYLLDGELGYETSTRHNMPIMDFNLTMRIVGSGPDEAIRKQAVNLQHGLGYVQYYIFDLLWSSEEGERVGDMQRVREAYLWNQAADIVNDDIEIVQTYNGFDEKVYEDYVEAGGEGVILKNPYAQYHPGKRPANNWYKVKKFETMEVIVTGFTAGQGKYEGMIGAIEFQVGGRIVRCSGMDDGTRFDITMSPQNYLHRVMEIRYFGKVGRDGSGLRFPQFLRWRPDKDPLGGLH